MRGLRGRLRLVLVFLGFVLWGDVSCAGPLRVKAMTFNIRLSRADDGENAWPRRQAMVAELIRRWGSDFVGVQEAWPEQIAFLSDALPEYRHLGRSREADARSGEAVPLFYRHARWSLDAAEHGTFWLSDTPEVPGSIGWGNRIPRVITWGRFVEKETGRGIYVYNAHLDHLSEASRVKSAAALAERIARRARPDPVLVLGDFNSGETSRAIGYLTGVVPGAPTRLVDTYRAVHPDVHSVGTYHGFGGSRTGAKIDYVLASPPARTLAAEIVHDQRDGRYPSDHFPVTAEVEFPEP
ncbi:MAG: endonuclease/exonuclease/phosphatase family protein [Thermoguttaceae bacterium]|jgi:endonuclease/exonuclease/phosphatase family metal-dependent hydrolase|nr:endonuclease/exonuclease/phosphatase family protein [Thermoguttaceae bacterium]